MGGIHCYFFNILLMILIYYIYSLFLIFIVFYIFKKNNLLFIFLNNKYDVSEFN